MAQFDVAADGSLSAKTPATVAAGNRPFGLAVSPDGRSAYVTDISGANVSQYDVAANGALSAKTPATVATPTGGFPQGVALTPDGHSAYVTSNVTNAVAQYDVAGERRAERQDPRHRGRRHQSVRGGSPARSGADGRLLRRAWRCGVGDNFRRFGLDRRRWQVARYDWDFGDGAVAANAGPTPSHTYAAGGSPPHTTYYYALVARDNVSSRRGPRSLIRARTG